MKSHEKDISHAEGLPFGKKKSGAGHDKVMDAKHNPAPQKKAMADHMRHINGKADPEGRGR